MRRPGQTHVPKGGPSTSGRDHTHLLPEEEISSKVRSLDHPNSENAISSACEAISMSGVDFNRIQQAHEVPANLYYIKNGRLEQLSTFVSAISDHYTVGRIVDGFVRPLYSENGKMVIVDNRDGSLHVINKEQAANLGINRAYIPNRH